MPSQRDVGETVRQVREIRNTALLLRRLGAAPGHFPPTTAPAPEVEHPEHLRLDNVASLRSSQPGSRQPVRPLCTARAAAVSAPLFPLRSAQTGAGAMTEVSR